jgi:hypothetical protein
VPHPISYNQTKLRERLKQISVPRLRSLETTIMVRLENCKRFLNWPALEQSYARDLKAIHDEMRFREQEKKAKA